MKQSFDLRVLLAVCTLSMGLTNAAFAERSTQLAAEIDTHIGALLHAEKVQPAPLASDAEFARRLYLDIVGRIPTVGEVREFLEDTSPNKRERLIDSLLSSPRFVTHWVSVWRRLLIPEVDSNAIIAQQSPAFEAWLRQQISEHGRYDLLAQRLLTTSVQDMSQGPSAQLFFTAKQAKPENLASTTARLFLGVRLECAQCHDHPFDRWKQEEFWSFAAFFASLEPADRENQFSGAVEIPDRRELKIPDSKQFVQARYLDGSPPPWDYRRSPRQQLADWLTNTNNDAFAKAGANRIWAHLFGVGLVDPVDDFSSNNPSSHPKLLQVLGDHFQASNYSIKSLIRGIALSETYQRTSHVDNEQPDERLFSHALVRGLTGEQLFDSIQTATGEANESVRGPTGQPTGERATFLETFANQPERSTDSQRSVLQALLLMNGTFIHNSTQGRTITAIVESPFLNFEERLEILFLATVTRPPTSSEVASLRFYKEQSKQNEREVLMDLFWSLLNSSEFLTNH